MIAVEIALAERLGWDLHSIDQTSIESLLPFLFQWMNQEKPACPRAKRKFIDQVRL